MSDFNLNDHVYRLLMNEPFYAALSRRIEKKRNDAIPTAGVRIDEDGRLELSYNAEFFEGLTDRQRQGVLIHEFSHIDFEHLTGRLPDSLAGVMTAKRPTKEQMSEFKLWNIAADLAINWHIGADKLPDSCCIPGGKMFEDFEGGHSAEIYFGEDDFRQQMSKIVRISALSSTEIYLR